MGRNRTIEEVKVMDDVKEKLAVLLKKVVEDGASIGFLPPMKIEDAMMYWETILQPDVLLFVAKMNNEVVGTVQLHLCMKQNGKHRAEICKLMVHPAYRRNGIGRVLMDRVIERAKQENRSLLILDTREGDSSNRLYISLGFIEGGKIPYYAESENGNLDTTVFYYKTI